MAKRFIGSLLFVSVLTGTTAAGFSVSSLRRELRRMVGYSIVSSDSVTDVLERDGQMSVRLLSGRIFRIDGIILAPLPASDVVIFAKPVPEALRRQYALPDGASQYRLLLDDEIVDATPLR